MGAEGRVKWGQGRDTDSCDKSIVVFGCEEGKQWPFGKSCKRVQSNTFPVTGPSFPALMLHDKWSNIVMTKHKIASSAT